MIPLKLNLPLLLIFTIAYRYLVGKQLVNYDKRRKLIEK